ncbi:MAG TPA: SDR family oxidoreductase [Anaeromyxobacteraceae bacterium]|nr:SDR family oxidoreductase [Anaeromyxobacteraceae bacterium]
MDRVALVVGASGQVGRESSRALAARGWSVVGTYRTRPANGLVPLDLLDEAALRRTVRELRPALLVISSALTNVDLCEEEPARAEAMNARAPRVLAEACRDAGGRTFFLSTEYVFDGERGPYGEDDPACPISVYGATKLEGERCVLAAAPGNLCLRTTVVYSFRPGDKNFVMQLRDRLSRGERMRVPADQVSTPTYAPDLGGAVAALADRDASGVLNVVGPDVLGRLDFAVRAAHVLALPENLLERVSTAELGQRARRPLRAGLRSGRLRALGIELRGVEAGLAAFAREAAP